MMMIAAAVVVVVVVVVIKIMVIIAMRVILVFERVPAASVLTMHSQVIAIQAIQRFDRVVRLSNDAVVG